MAGIMDLNDAPVFLRDFLTYIDTIKGKSRNTASAYYSDLRTFLRFVKIQKKILSPPDGFYSNNPDEAINSIRDISINDVSLDIVSSISLTDIYEYMAYLNRTRANNARSRARKVASLKSLYQYLTVKANLITENPVKELESPKIGKSLPRHLNLDESTALLGVVHEDVNNVNKERDYLILTLFLNCGLRLHELVGINIKDISANKLTVIGKGNKERTIYLNDACIAAFEQYLPLRNKIPQTSQSLDDKKALFLNKNHARLGERGVQNIVKKYIKLAGLDANKFSTHKLRHTAATLMYTHGNVDIRALQEILGHQNLSTTEIYTHIDDERLRRAVANNPLANLKP